MLGLDILHQVQSTFASYNDKFFLLMVIILLLQVFLKYTEKKNKLYTIKKIVSNNEKNIWDVDSSKSEDLILKKIDTLHALISCKAARS